VSKPKAPAPPDYAAAATAQGKANENSAVATNFLNQDDQIGPYGSLTYSYDNSKGLTLPDGTVIPHATATTTLSPEQQHLLDQQTGISTQLNDLASQGIGYVGNEVKTPIDQSGLPAMGTMPNPGGGTAQRDEITKAYMDRLQPYIDHDRAAIDTKLANQGITHGSEAYGYDNDVFNKGVNDQRIAALLAGDAQQQNEFNRGLASAQFGNQSRQQAIQEADYFKNQPLNMLNALRSGGQVNLPQFGNVSGGASIGAAPIYNAAQDQYAAAMQQYQQKLAAQNSIMQGVAGIGSAAIMASDRRLKTNIQKLYTRLDGLGVYLYQYIWGKWHIGVMADEVAELRPEALGPSMGGFMTVNYGRL
jgi:hypothetical protein